MGSVACLSREVTKIRKNGCIEPKNAYERAIRRQVRLIVIQILATAAVLTRTGGGATPEEMISVVSEPFLSD